MLCFSVEELNCLKLDIYFNPLWMRCHSGRSKNICMPYMNEWPLSFIFVLLTHCCRFSPLQPNVETFPFVLVRPFNHIIVSLCVTRLKQLPNNMPMVQSWLQMLFFINYVALFYLIFFRQLILRTYYIAQVLSSLRLSTFLKEELQLHPSYYLLRMKVYTLWIIHRHHWEYLFIPKHLNIIQIIRRLWLRYGCLTLVPNIDNKFLILLGLKKSIAIKIKINPLAYIWSRSPNLVMQPV